LSGHLLPKNPPWWKSSKGIRNLFIGEGGNHSNSKTPPSAKGPWPEHLLAQGEIGNSSGKGPRPILPSGFKKFQISGGGASILLRETALLTRTDGSRAEAVRGKKNVYGRFNGTSFRGGGDFPGRGLGR